MALLNNQMCFLYLTCDYSTLAHKLTVIKQMINVICSYKECFTESKPLTVPKSINVILLQYWKRKLLKAGRGECVDVITLKHMQRFPRRGKEHSWPNTVQLKNHCRTNLMCVRLENMKFDFFSLCLRASVMPLVDFTKLKKYYKF